MLLQRTAHIARVSSPSALRQLIPRVTSRARISRVQIMAFSRLVRFVPKSDSSKILVGEPADSQQDVGLATRKGEKVEINVLSGSSALSPGLPTGNVEEVGRLLSPLSRDEVGTIRCIGLNYRQHAAEVKMAIPTEPTVFLKPALGTGRSVPSADDCSEIRSQGQLFRLRV